MKKLILSILLILSPLLHADFGEIDLLVRESVENYFREDNKLVDMEKFEFSGEPKANGKTLIVRSSVWAEQNLVAPNWGWHECTTKIMINADQTYSDLGSDCFFDFD